MTGERNPTLILLPLLARIKSRGMNECNMRKKKGEKKNVITENRIVLDAYESWLERQPVKSVRAKSGFIGAEKTEEGS